MENRGQGESGVGSDDQVNMVWHNAPRTQRVTLILEVQQSTLDDRCSPRVPQKAAADERFEVEFGCDEFWVVFGLKVRFSVLVLGHSIAQAKGHEIGAAILVDVREVASPSRRHMGFGPRINDSVREFRNSVLAVSHDFRIISFRCAMLWCGRRGRTCASDRYQCGRDARTTTCSQEHLCGAAVPAAHLALIAVSAGGTPAPQFRSAIMVPPPRGAGACDPAHRRRCRGAARLRQWVDEPTLHTGPRLPDSGRSRHELRGLRRRRGGAGRDPRRRHLRAPRRRVDDHRRRRSRQLDGPGVSHRGRRRLVRGCAGDARPPHPDRRRRAARPQLVGGKRPLPGRRVRATSCG